MRRVELVESARLDATASGPSARPVKIIIMYALAIPTHQTCNRDRRKQRRMAEMAKRSTASMRRRKINLLALLRSDPPKKPRNEPSA